FLQLDSIVLDRRLGKISWWRYPYALAYFGSTSWCTVFEVPPSGGGLNTCTETARSPIGAVLCVGPGAKYGFGPAREIELAGLSNSSRRGPRNFVFTETPFTRTSDVIMKPLPSSTTRTFCEPSVTLLGSITLIVGAKVAAASERGRCVNVKYSG